MSEFRSFLGRLVAPGICPAFDENNLPVCTTDECPKFDGKRCAAIGAKPDTYCEPALISIVRRLHEEVEE